MDTQKTAGKTAFPKITFSIRRQFPFLILGLAPVIVFYCVEWFTHNPWIIMEPKVQLWNILFYELIYLLLFFLTGGIRPAVITGTLFFLIVGLTNYFIIQFRSAPIVPWDIYSLRTALSVADNYEYSLSFSCYVVLVILALLLVAGFFCRWRFSHASLKRRLLCAAACVLALTGYTLALHQDAFIKYMRLDNTLFTPYYMSRKNGFTTAFLMDLKYLSVEVPDSYSPEEAAGMLAAYPEDTADGPLPNIIVVMNEAFSDPAVLGDFTPNKDYMPFVHRLMAGAENTVSGYLNVSVKGGNTANTEYEFLTGNTMRFLPGGSVPYQQYIFGKKPSLVSWLEKLGYATAAIHPYNSTGWNRDKVYDWFGFDDILFNSRFPGAERIRKYIDDAACYDKIRELYEAKEDGTPLFVFTVTMQNHSGYSEEFDNFTPDITVEGSTSKLLSRYLSLMEISDQALEDFISYFEQEEEKTVIVFFGDHQPNDVVIESIWKLHGKSSNTLSDEDSDLRYQVPCLIWANYPIESATGNETSANYLASQVLTTAGVPLSEYLSYLGELHEKYPIVSTQRLADAEGRELSSEEEEVNEDITDYRRIQYYRMYDAPDEQE